MRTPAENVIATFDQPPDAKERGQATLPDLRGYFDFYFLVGKWLIICGKKTSTFTAVDPAARTTPYLNSAASGLACLSSAAQRALNIYSPDANESLPYKKR